MCKKKTNLINNKSSKYYKKAKTKMNNFKS